MTKARVNVMELSDFYLKNQRWRITMTHSRNHNMYSDLALVFPKNDILELAIYEAPNDLLPNTQFSISERPADNMPMPFILNDAILVTKTLRYD